MFSATILDKISSGLCVINKDHRVVLWNWAMQVKTGVAGHEISGEKLDAFFPGFKNESIIYRLDMVLEGGAPIVFSPLLHRNLFKSKESQVWNSYLEITIDSFKTELGERNLIFTVRDVTELNLQIQKFKQMRDKARDAERELTKVNGRLQELADTDPLTGLLNRRSTMVSLELELARFERQKTPFSLVLADIDHFKQLNDTYGHDFGDQVLVKISQIFKDNLRSLDLASRWGGEEFLIVLSGTDCTGAIEVAEKLRSIIEDLDYGSDYSEIRTTMSFGVTCVDPDIAGEALIKRADIALYQAKDGGRNRVVAYEGLL